MWCHFLCLDKLLHSFLLVQSSFPFVLVSLPYFVSSTSPLWSLYCPFWLFGLRSRSIYISSESESLFYICSFISFLLLHFSFPLLRHVVMCSFYVHCPVWFLVIWQPHRVVFFVLCFCLLASPGTLVLCCAYIASLLSFPSVMVFCFCSCL